MLGLLYLLLTYIRYISVVVRYKLAMEWVLLTWQRFAQITHGVTLHG